MADLEKELLYRLLTFNTGLHGYKETIRVGELPPSFPVALPPGTTLLGSLEQRYPRLPASTTGMQMQDHTRVMVDSSMSVSAFMDTIRQGLSSDWQDHSWPPYSMGGFIAPNERNALSFYSPELELILNAEGIAVNGLTQAVLILNVQTREQFERMRPHRERREQQFSVQVPQGVTVYPGQSGGGSGQWHASAVLETSKPATELLDAFTQQLSSRGWTEQGRTVTQSVGSANWSDEQGGLVMITLSPTETGFAAQMMTSQTSRESGLG